MQLVDGTEPFPRNQYVTFTVTWSLPNEEECITMMEARAQFALPGFLEAQACLRTVRLSMGIKTPII